MISRCLDSIISVKDEIIMKIHHVGYLVRKMDRALDKFQELGYTLEEEPLPDGYRDADIAFLLNDGYRIELVCPHKTSDVYPLLKKFGNAPYHICYETENLESEEARLKDMGYTVFIPRQPAPAIGDDIEVIFLIHSQMGMVELAGK